MQDHSGVWMVELKNLEVNYVEAKKQKEITIKSMDIYVNIDNMRIINKELIIDFIYNVKYENDLGYIKISGKVHVIDEQSRLKQLEEEWKKTKKIPNRLAEILLNVINFSAGVRGVFVSQAINLPPPLVPPRVQLTNVILPDKK